MLQDQIQTPSQKLEILSNIENKLLGVIAEFEGLNNRTLDGYNEAWLQKDLMITVMTNGQRQIDMAKEELREIEMLKKQIIEVL